MYRCLLHAFRWTIFCGIYGRHSAVLYIYWLVDVHSIRLGKSACQVIVWNGGGLDRGDWRKKVLVLLRLWSVVGFWWHSLAGNKLKFHLSSLNIFFLNILYIYLFRCLRFISNEFFPAKLQAELRFYLTLQLLVVS